jgi:hypothetical protein
MPINDWRTDNWGDRRDLGRDPKQWSFARSTHDLGLGWFKPFGETEKPEKHYSIWTIGSWLVILLLVAAIIPEVRFIFELIGKSLEAWFQSFDIMAAEFR